MPPLSAHSRSLLRLQSGRYIPTLIAPTTQCIAQQQRRTKASAVRESSGEFESTPRFNSPFRSKEDNPTTKIPSFANYMSKKGETTNKTFHYFMVGGMGLLAAAGAKATVQGKCIYATKRGYIFGSLGTGSEHQSPRFRVEEGKGEGNASC